MAEKLLNVRVTPNTGGCVTLTRTLSVLSSPRNTASAAPEKHACADGYSGCGGVPRSGSHAASPASVRNFAGGSSSDRCYRPPVQAIILVLEAGDLGIRGGNGQEGKEVQIVEQRCLALGGCRPCCRKPWYASLHRPKHGCRRLIGSPRAAVARAKQLHFIEVGLELRVVQAGRSLSFVAIRRAESRKDHRAPMS